MEWIDAQDAAKNYPDFGDHCSIIGLSVLPKHPYDNGTKLKEQQNLCLAATLKYYEREMISE